MVNPSSNITTRFGLNKVNDNVTHDFLLFYWPQKPHDTATATNCNEFATYRCDAVSFSFAFSIFIVIQFNSSIETIIHVIQLKCINKIIAVNVRSSHIPSFRLFVCFACSVFARFHHESNWIVGKFNAVRLLWLLLFVLLIINSIFVSCVCVRVCAPPNNSMVYFLRSE